VPRADVLRTLLRELLTRSRTPRTPEPDLVMDDPSSVAAYVRAGRADGVMAPVYLFHCAHACEVIAPGDAVVDLACGPANQLAMIAQMNPDTRFIGVDLSDRMLAAAQQLIDELGLRNVTFRHGDISRLSDLADGSVDAVVSTMALHHLPGVAHLDATFAEIARIVKPGGGIYLVDFGRLKSEKSIHYFAHQYADRQPAAFTTDYLNSLHAAFSLADFGRAGAAIEGKAARYSTFLAPFMVAFKSARRRRDPSALRRTIGEARARLPRTQQVDLRDLDTFFSLGGMRSAAL
jgi:SAM-dependent methyltransferase